MLSRRQLRKALRKIPLVRFEGALCRTLYVETLYELSKGTAHSPRPLFNLGAPKKGARYTPKGGAPALYLAGDHGTSLHECLGVGRHALLVPKGGQRAVVSYVVTVRLERVLDLADQAVCDVLGTNPAELGESWRYRRDGRRAPTQVLGQAAVDDGCIQAIRFKSTKGAGECYVIFTDALVAPAFVRICDAHSRLVGTLP